MSKYGFLDILEEEMDKVFPFDFEINWDKKNHAVEVAFLLEAQNTGGVALVDEAGEESDEDIFFEVKKREGRGSRHLSKDRSIRKERRSPRRACRPWPPALGCSCGKSCSACGREDGSRNSFRDHRFPERR